MILKFIIWIPQVKQFQNSATAPLCYVFTGCQLKSEHMPLSCLAVEPVRDKKAGQSPFVSQEPDACESWRPYPEGSLNHDIIEHAAAAHYAGALPWAGLGSGSALSCCIIPSMSYSSHSSAILPPTMRSITMPLILTCRPVAAIPMISF